MRTKARDSEDKGQRQDVLGVVQDGKEAGVTGAGLGEDGGVGGVGARGWGGATSGKVLWTTVKTRGLLFCWKPWVGFEQKSDLL